MAKILAFCNQKGGVGKTTSVVNIAAVLAEQDLKVLVVDLDPQGNSTSGLGIEKADLETSTYDVIIGRSNIKEAITKSPVNGLDILPSLPGLAGAEVELVSYVGREFVLQEKLSGINGRYDIILIDCPPSLGLLTLNALTSAHYLIIPLQCEYYALEGLGQLLNTFRLVKGKINQNLEIGGVILTMADMRTNLTLQVIDEIRKHFPDNMFHTIIPRSVRISEAPSFGKPVVIYARESKGAQSYRKLAEEFQKRFFEGEMKAHRFSEGQATGEKKEASLADVGQTQKEGQPL